MSIKCNHLVIKHEQNRKCSSEPGSKTHYWIPTGHIEAKFNNLIQIDFMCKYCDKRTINFLTQQEYDTNKRLLGVN